ncbi:hypothetical protein LIER_25715 [Lithospermum erythrorhizon]|uniref:AP2/ERF domain-containing protein n=1 Tax=Lithospermum erythrorhizon TaxID=34254 RepID=A0AAV3R9H6_LITER
MWLRNNNKTTICDVQESIQVKRHSLFHKHKDLSCSNVCDAQTSSKKFVGVSKKGTGYGARIHNPVSRKYQRLGVFKSAEEASMAYLAKKVEFQKLVKGKKGIQGVVCDEKIKKVVDQRSSGKARISKGEKNCDMLEKKMVGVNKQKNGKYNARMKHPISKKGIWLGTFDSAEEAAMVYLAKKKELEKVTQSNEEGVEWIVCNKKVIKKSSDQLDPSSEGSNHHVPCSDNQDCSMEIEPNDSLNGESASGMENLPIQNNVELEKELLATEGMEWGVTKDNEIRRNTDQLGAIFEQNNNEPCSNNQDSSMPIEPNDSFDGESASRMENIAQIQKNEGSAGYEFSTDSSVWSGSGTEILLRTESGIPIMDSHGFLLGEWSWIDNLSLPK